MTSAALNTAMRRGDLVTVAASGDYGKPRPAVIVQTDAFPATHASVVVCQMTSDLIDAPEFRVMLNPSQTNGLRGPSQVMVDKPVTVRRETIGQTIGRLGAEELGRLNIALLSSWASRIEAMRATLPLDDDLAAKAQLAIPSRLQ